MTEDLKNNLRVLNNTASSNKNLLLPIVSPTQSETGVLAESIKISDFLLHRHRSPSLELFELCQNLCYDVNILCVNKISEFLLHLHRSPILDINAVNISGHTALSMCLDKIRIVGGVRGVESENVKAAVVNLLTNNGANVHIRIPSVYGKINGMLHFVCNRYITPDIVQLLIDKGINPNEHKQTPLHFASVCTHLKMMSLL